MNSNSLPVAASSYPFTTKAQVKARLDSDPVFQVVTCIEMHRRQTASEQAKQDTEVKNSRGFMSSDAKRGSQLVERILAGLAGEAPSMMGLAAFVTPEDWDLIGVIAPKYSAQMSRVIRAQELAAKPELRAAAKLFSADQRLDD